MKAFIAAVVAAVALAIGAAYVLDARVQQTVEVRFTTSGVRL